MNKNNLFTGFFFKLSSKLVAMKVVYRYYLLLYHSELKKGIYNLL